MNHIKSAIAAALLLAAPMAHAELCNPTEPVAHRVKRALSNLWHPHRPRIAYAPSVPLICREPDLQTVSIEAPPWVPLTILDAPSPSQGYGAGGYYSPAVVIWATPGEPIPQPERPDFKPIHETQPVPAPPGFWVMAAGLLAVLLIRRRKASR